LCKQTFSLLDPSKGHQNRGAVYFG
jgi:hypothetical protein